MLITFKPSIHSFALFLWHDTVAMALARLMSHSQPALWLISCSPALYFHISPGLDHVCTFLTDLFHPVWGRRRAPGHLFNRRFVLFILALFFKPTEYPAEVRNQSVICICCLIRSRAADSFPWQEEPLTHCHCAKLQLTDKQKQVGGKKHFKQFYSILFSAYRFSTDRSWNQK